MKPNLLGGSMKHLFYFLGAVPAFYWWHTYSGPFWLLSEFQINQIGVHYPALSFTLIAGVTGFILTVVYQFLSKSFNPEGDEENDDKQAGLFDVLYNQPVGVHKSAGIAIGALIAGAYIFIPTINSTEMQPVGVDQLIHGYSGSNWVEAKNGKFDWDLSVIEEEKYAELSYVPMLSHASQSGEPVTVFVATYKGPEELHGSVQGLIEPMGLPHQIRQFFENEIGVKIADNHLLIRHSYDPNERRTMSLIVFAVALGAMGVGAFMYDPNILNQTPPNGSEPQQDSSPLETTNSIPIETESANNSDDAVAQWLKDRGIQK